MDRRKIMIVISLTCLVAAGMMFFKTHEKKSGLSSMKGQTVWVKCNNPDCGAVYEMDAVEFYNYINEHQGPNLLVPPALPCKECGKESVYMKNME